MVTNSWLFIGWALLLAGVAWAEPIPDPVELPRNPPKDLDEALESFQVHRDFRIELVAGEPQVVDPVAITFDENGRLFVAEMRGYPERREEALGRIKLLEDLDGDGRYEKATTFAAGLKWPTGLACWKGGLFVAASPDILYLEDQDGDGVAEKRTVVFSGFGAGLNRLNMQALVNGLQWGPDGRIYGSTASNGGLVKARDPKAKVLNLRGSDFSFDPHSLDLRPESGTAQYGLTFDDYGRRYLCSNSRHLIAVMYSWPWNKVPGLPHPLVDIPVDGGAAEVYRISKVEPWRVVRTRWRVQGLVGGPVEGGRTGNGLLYLGERTDGVSRGRVSEGLSRECLCRRCRKQPGAPEGDRVSEESGAAGGPAGEGRGAAGVPGLHRQFLSSGAVRERPRWCALHRGHVPGDHRAPMVDPGIDQETPRSLQRE